MTLYALFSWVGNKISSFYHVKIVSF